MAKRRNNRVERASSSKSVEKPTAPAASYITKFVSKSGTAVQFFHALEYEFSVLVEAGLVDSFIVSAEDGFSPLGSARQFFSAELGISEAKIQQRAEWSHSLSETVTLIAFDSLTASRLKGVILGPGENSKAYKKYRQIAGPRPYRDFYHNVTREAVAYASRMWGAKRIGISHLSASQKFHEDIAMCNAEGAVHAFDRTTNPTVDRVTFVGCCISPKQLAGIKELKLEEHRPIRVEAALNLSWAELGVDAPGLLHC